MNRQGKRNFLRQVSADGSGNASSVSLLASHVDLIRAIPYQDPEMEAERLKAVHEARVKIVPRV
jgi:hypothetical protein